MRLRQGSGPGHDPDAVDVLLDEWDPSDDEPRSPGTGEVTGTDGAAGRPGRRRTLRLAAVGTLVLAGVVAVNVVEADSTAARLAALAEVPGFLRPVEHRLTEAWRRPGQVIAEGGALLLVSDPERRSLQGLDPTTGAVIWTTAGEAGSAAATGYCFTVDEDVWLGQPSGRAGGARTPALVACVADPPGGVVSGQAAEPGIAVVIVDPATGETLHSLSADGSLVTAEPVGRDLLVALALEDGRLLVVRWDLASGHARWSYTSTHAIFANEPLMVESIERRPDSLTITSVGVVSVDLTTGEALDWREVSRLPAWYDVTALPDGAEAVWTWDADGDSGSGRVHVDGDSRWYSLPGPPVRPALHDGSVPGTLVVMTADKAHLKGLDLSTGRWLWSTDADGGSGVVQSDGVLVVNEGGRVVAVDVRSGDPLWQAQVYSPLSYGTVLSDGELVLLPELDERGAFHLVARQLRDGTEVWRTSLPDDTVALRLADRRVVVSTRSGVVGLG